MKKNKYRVTITYQIMNINLENILVILHISIQSVV